MSIYQRLDAEFFCLDQRPLTLELSVDQSQRCASVLLDEVKITHLVVARTSRIDHSMRFTNC